MVQIAPARDPPCRGHHTRFGRRLSRAVCGAATGNKDAPDASVYCTGVQEPLAALVCQVDPGIEPARIVELWTATPAKTAAGRIVNPPAFIEAVRADRDKRRP
jgi:hypothetical protein